MPLMTALSIVRSHACEASPIDGDNTCGQVIQMLNNDPLAPLPAGAAYDAGALVALDADFNLRWDAWLARGRVHEQMVRRRLMVAGGVLVGAAAIVYVFLSGAGG